MIEYFRKLSEEEVYKFEKYVYSPYFNSQKSAVKLFEYLKSLYPDITDEHLSKKNISIVVFSESEINEVKVRKLVSNFSILLEKFLLQLVFESNDLPNKVLLLNSLRRRGFTKRFQMNYNELVKKMDLCKLKDSNYYNTMSQMEDEYYYFNFSQLKSEFSKSIQKKSDYLDYSFIFSKLHTFHEMIHAERNTGNKTAYDKTFLNEIIAFVENNTGMFRNDHPNIFVIYLVVQTLLTTDEKYLNELENYLDKNENNLEKSSISYYYNYITQFYIQKVNAGIIEYRIKAFKVYKIMMEKDLFLIDNLITDFEFNNVTNIALALEEYQWLDKFIEKYKDNIDPEFCDSAYGMAKAKLSFRKKEFDNVLKYLNSIDFKDPNYYINSKFILARVYYEMDNLNGIKYILNNLRQYIRLHKNVLADQAATVNIFNKYMSELLKVYESRNSHKKFGAVVLKKELDKEKALVPTKIWFYEKLAELS